MTAADGESTLDKVLAERRRREPMIRLHRSRSVVRRGRHVRTGTTTVEFALICPVMFAVFFASVELGRANQVLNATANAAYQGCRRAIIPGATTATVQAAAQNMLDAGLIKKATITINPATITNSTTTVTVTVSVPMNDNSWIGQTFTKGSVVTRACTLTRERTN